MLIGHFEPADAHHTDASALLKASLDLPAADALRLGELRATTKLKMPDCPVLYTAEQHSAAIATFDARLAARASDLGLSIATN